MVLTSETPVQYSCDAAGAEGASRASSGTAQLERRSIEKEVGNNQRELVQSTESTPMT